ncbi:hypothetical protein BpHYR1_052036 [Brachionus plicatilis]|uniref:Uncharacterized protein n=1 Tax=Brachionus plicatilis TaxID=10195 RepID=A0A3M7Q7B4_BRAPC|nr:hypothetical protein BpHYR1_052036 [Brachionus plicatilis]
MEIRITDITHSCKIFSLMLNLLFAYKWNKKSKLFQHINDVYMVKNEEKTDTFFLYRLNGKN